ncbi:hypothetical protein IJV79_01855 [bacterium]|nr:hypothetical protein [bacterium]
MKKFLASILTVFILTLNCGASELYFVQKSTEADMQAIVEKAFDKKNIELTKKNPYYGTGSRERFGVVVLQSDSNGVYCYFDGDERLNKELLKQIKKRDFEYSIVMGDLKSSFVKIADEKIFGKKTQYSFDETAETSVTNDKKSGSSKNKNVIYGYIATLNSGTVVPAYLQTELNTQAARKGDVVTMVLSQDLLYNGKVAAIQGSLIQGTVKKAKSAGYARQNGELHIDFDTLILPSGKIYNISTELVKFEVESENKASVVKSVVAGALGATLIALMCVAGGSSNVGKVVAIGAGVGALGGAVYEGAQKGSDAIIPALTEINLTLTQPLYVTIE